MPSGLQGAEAANARRREKLARKVRGSPVDHLFLAEDMREVRWKLVEWARQDLRGRGLRNGITGCGMALPNLGDGQAHPTFREEVPAPDGTSKFREETSKKRLRIGIDNLGWCGSARCPRCAPLVGMKLAERIKGLLAAAAEQGIGVALWTPTIWHHAGMTLKAQRVAMSGAHKALLKSPVYADEKAGGLITICPSWEQTVGKRTGWHHHGHHLVLHRDGAAAAVEAAKRIEVEYRRILARRGWRADEEAQDVRPVTTPADLGGYIGKAMTRWGAAAELAGAWHKEGRAPDRLTLPQLLGLAYAGDAWAADRYAEAVEALSGQRLFYVAPHARKLLGLTKDKATITDGEGVEPEKQPGRVLGILPAEVWNRAARRSLRAWTYATVRDLVAAGVEWCDVAEVVRDRVMRLPARRNVRPLVGEEIRSPAPRPPPPD